MHVGKVDIYFDAFDPDYPVCFRHKQDIVTCEKTEGCTGKCGAVVLLELGTIVSKE